MKKLIENISQRIGITTTELATFIFVVVIFVLGLAANYTKNSISSKPVKKFDYSFQDSLFKALNKKSNKQNVLVKKKEKRVDSEAELLDFSNKKFDSKNRNNVVIKENSININTANEVTLTLLPGIGKTIAKRIVEMRRRKGGFVDLEELLEVKRIGTKKLNNIKKYLYIEK